MMPLVLVGMVVLACAAFVLAWLEWRTSQQTTQQRGLSELDMTADGSPSRKPGYRRIRAAGLSGQFQP
jgi:hypothetical protein